MLEKYFFEGFEVLSSSFREINIGEEGFITVNTDDPEVSYEPVEEEDEQSFRISMLIDAKIRAYSGPKRDDPEESDLAFESNAVFKTFFYLRDADEFDEDFIQNNLWYFERFNVIALKLVTENILRHTSLNYLPIPWISG
ncbi:TPA: hypothetical protein ACWW9G_004573 [Klebsiella pneumoniae]|uniref:hypothetical protein n=1 Tax=Klebsiella pneumoniae TaxID=573 RepID=UPI0006D074ED|nr:hypothetical protein [Klebsiella pneumoniae]KAB7952415.1 hypothetical protein GCK88_24560 [Klebsiella pneumoniae]KAB7963619.1 hypothetical protein GCK99_17885 [Klebsiella pneumoniae]KAB8020159.1 hypothetical protein GCL00_26870 [Klebsiella pneumoniae]NBZ17473.1 hypothetical protein [Klebsiella pneumoniae]NBZ57938.1 hypothetical protein [Klebsiella pneumoniae]